MLRRPTATERGRRSGDLERLARAGQADYSHRASGSAGSTVDDEFGVGVDVDVDLRVDADENADVGRGRPSDLAGPGQKDSTDVIVGSLWMWVTRK